MPSSNRLLLNYHDVCIYKSDLELLQHPHAWLNDACINFQFTRIQKQLDACADSDVTLVDPSVLSFFMHQCTDEEELMDFYTSQGMGRTETLIFLFAINDDNASNYAMAGTTARGSHWSLLLVRFSPPVDDGGKGQEPRRSTFLHFDSSAGSNMRAAKAVARKIQALLRVACNDKQLPKSLPVDATVVECETHQQQNGYDCGLCTLAAAEAIGHALVGHNESSPQQKPSERECNAEELRTLCENAIQTYFSSRKTSITSGGFDVAASLRSQIAADVQSLIAEKK